MKEQNTVLVLGATGGIGGEVAKQLCDSGWQVRALSRHPNAITDQIENITWLKGDVLSREDVEFAAKGCNIIVHAVNPPGYRNWGETVLPMLNNTICAARKSNATIVLPGSIYNYGHDAFPVLAEDDPQQPETRKGIIRVAMEQRLQDFAENGGRVIIVRAGDFFGRHRLNNWFAQALVKPGKAVTTIRNPGVPGVGHQWSYLPDVARTLVLLLERRDQLESFARFHLGGHWDSDGTQMVEAIARVVTAHKGKAPKIAAFPWWQIKLLSPFVETLHEILEMRYLWRHPVRLDNSRIKSVLKQEPHTPWDRAIEDTLKGLGCLSSG